MVHLTGIEPAHLSILDPKSSASASSATGAYIKLFTQRYHQRNLACLPIPPYLQLPQYNITRDIKNQVFFNT